MRRDAQSVLLILVGGAILRISVSDIYLRYVKEGLRPFLLAAGACLLMLGVVGAVRDGLLLRSRGRREGSAAGVGDSVAGTGAAGTGAAVEGAAGPGSTGAGAVGAGGDGGHDHDHGHGPAIAWLLCLPVFAIFLVAPPALGSYAANRDAGTVAKPSGDSDYAPLPAGDPVSVPVTEYAVRAVWDHGRTLAGRRVALRGFVTMRKDGGWYVTRMVLSCCAADARALKVEVRGAQPLPMDTWVEVVGRWEDNGQAAAETAIPVIRAEKVQEIGAPKDPYE